MGCGHRLLLPPPREASSPRQPRAAVQDTGRPPEGRPRPQVLVGQAAPQPRVPSQAGRDVPQSHLCLQAVGARQPLRTRTAGPPARRAPELWKAQGGQPRCQDNPTERHAPTGPAPTPPKPGLVRRRPECSALSPTRGSESGAMAGDSWVLVRPTTNQPLSLVKPPPVRTLPPSGQAHPLTDQSGPSPHRPREAGRPKLEVKTCPQGTPRSLTAPGRTRPGRQTASLS